MHANLASLASTVFEIPLLPQVWLVGVGMLIYTCTDIPTFFHLDYPTNRTSLVTTSIYYMFYIIIHYFMYN